MTWMASARWAGSFALCTILAGSGTTALAAPDGAELFKQRCQACHSDTAGKPAGVGPNLAGVVGRKAGSTSYNYSAALKSSGLTWTKSNLDQFLSGPAKKVPGTRMVMTISDKAQRAALIAYLEKKR